MNTLSKWFNSVTSKHGNKKKIQEIRGRADKASTRDCERLHRQLTEIDKIVCQMGYKIQIVED